MEIDDEAIQDEQKMEEFSFEKHKGVKKKVKKSIKKKKKMTKRKKKKFN